MFFPRDPCKRAVRGQQGYGLLLVVFCMTLILIATMTVAPRILVQRRREREKEMIWRGHQYVRAITLYRRKTGRFPTSLDDLVKGQAPNNAHFLRRQYTDPMNQADGSWRLIYITPAGQLVGSMTTLSPVPQWNMAMLLSNKQGQLASTNSASPSNSTVPQSGDSIQVGTVSSATGQSDNQAASQVDANGDSPTIIGGNIVGVASKIDRESVIYYKKEHNYRRFEFIWDAAKEMGAGVIDQQLVPPSKAPDPVAPGSTEPQPTPRPPS